MISRAFLPLCCLVPGAPSIAQEPLVLPRITGEIRIDGVVDEPAWAAIEPLPLVMQMPDYPEPPSERTVIRVAYDDQYVYVSGEMYADPDEIVATSFKRDLFAPSTDYLGLMLDTFADNENAVAFWTTPTGLRLDYTIFNDGEGRTPGAPGVDASWNTFWDAAATENEQGWFAEMRIPFSSLRFQETDGKVVMGLIAIRWMAHKYEMDIFPAIPPDWGFWSFAKPSHSQPVVMDVPVSRRPLYVSPYVLGGMGQDFRLNAAGTAYDRHDEPSSELGLDLKYGLTDNLTLDLTYNTDFAQVEADDQQVNLTRFSLFFPEKRQFFLERSSVFDFNLGGTSRLFYSRRIGLYEGEVVPILAGARLVGRVGDWDVGVLNMQTAAMPELGPAPGLASENVGVVRFRRQVLNPYSYAGGIATSRVGSDGSASFSYGADGILRLFGQDYVSLALAQTLGDEQPAGEPLLESLKMRASWERRTTTGPGYNLSFTRAGAAFDPSLGYQRRLNYMRLGAQTSYGWVPGKSSRIQRHRVELGGAAYLRNEDGSLESAEFGPAWRGAPKGGGAFEVELQAVREELSAPFFLDGDVGVPVGNYTFPQLTATFETSRGRPASLVSTLVAGGYYDGRILGIALEPSWITSRYLQFSGYYQGNMIRFPERDLSVGLHVARLRTLLTLNTRFSAAAFVQFISTSDAVIANIRLRYNPSEGRDLYVVYNEGLNTDRYGVYPVLPFTRGRTLLLKYTHTLPL